MRMARCTSHSVAWLFLKTHLGRIQASPTLNLIEDYVRFVLAFFEVINMSAPHIYHSALPLSPRKSIAHETYKKHANPFVRVVQGMPPDSWERVVATATFDDDLRDVIWSPCNRFIAVAKPKSLELLDAVTLGRLRVFETSYISPGRQYILPEQQLGFSPDSRLLTLRMGQKVISWDLQTGGRISIITPWVGMSSTERLSFKHSEDGKMVAVVYRPPNSSNGNRRCSHLIYTYDHLSGRRVGPCHVPEGQVLYEIWTHNEYLRFATIDQRSIRIWQSPFTLEHPPVEVAFLPVPDGITDAEQFLFLPSLSRLAFILGDTVQVWDLKTLKLLLKSELTLPDWIRNNHFPWGSFSSDGRFFAYTNTAGEFCVWEDSPAGYLLRKRLPFLTSPSFPAPQLSPNGESIVVPLGSKICRWHTRDQDLFLPNVSAGDSGGSTFTLGFSPDEKFAAFGRQLENTFTIIDLQSGEPRWIANVGVKIDCLGMAGSTVVLVGEEKIVTWNLPGGYSAFNASIDDSVRTTVLHHSSKHPDWDIPIYTSLSPDFSRIMVVRILSEESYSLEVHNVSTGLCLARTITHNAMRPWFTPDGREVWAQSRFLSEKFEQCEIIEDSESGTIELKLQSADARQSGVFRESSSGYTVTDSGWVLSPSQKRLLWLPHCWRSYSNLDRAWGGRFLGLLHGELSEAVVLEFLE